MNEYAKLYQFENLYRAHRAARLGKRGNKEVIEFEVRLAENLTILADQLRRGTYRIGGYYTFMVHDPKDRVIHALHYRDRVVQHCLCDNILMPMIEPKLIYDNAACRIGKGTDFARDRLTGFLHENGPDGWLLKCDIRKFFDNIDHEVLKRQLHEIFEDERILQLLENIIDSYSVSPGKGLPLGNQTSQWFAILYLNKLDRMIKEKWRVRYYSRYMDDMMLIHPDKTALKQILAGMREYAKNELRLEFNEKTQIFPIKNGAEYLGFRFYMNANGRVIRKLSRTAKARYKNRLRELEKAYGAGEIDSYDVSQVLNSYLAHLSKGDTFQLRKNTVGRMILRRSEKARS